VSSPTGWQVEHSPVTLTSEEFAWFTSFLRRWTGIELRPGKESLVMGRLERRLRHHQLTSYTEYFTLLGRRDEPAETQIAIDLMTTNETYFFREPPHFQLLPELLPETAPDSRPVRIWSAASSTGEEAYSIALTLAGCLFGTDLSSRVIETARRGLYPIEAASRIPERLLTHCRRGRGEFEGLFTVSPALRSRVSFRRANLTRTLRDPGQFDVIFLRNIMIYFDAETKRQVLDQLVATLRPGGSLIIGHAESLTGLGTKLRPVRPSVYQVATG
jgi:chemotaxis protein methyltransferase CheR